MLLENINSPQDLKKLTSGQLAILGSEIRDKIVSTVSQNGGHLASSLGAVELIIALHYCLDCPKDKIVFDVGHQAYAHKLLTGRNAQFSSLRQFGGISGFPSKDESIYDAFTVGHSSNAVSLALGLACARETLPKEAYFKVAAVIGDGSLSGGLCFEGLNNAGHLKKDLLVVLNTNELSIAPNVGALSTYLNKIISLPIYNRFKASLEKFTTSRIPKGSRIIKLANKFEEGLKGLFIPGMFFEELGFKYFGPFDGHNLELLIRSLKNISTIKGPILFHVITKKGKGYLPAEKEPVRFHGTGSFNINTGESSKIASTSYTDIFSKKLVELAQTDKKIIAITAAMPEGTGLDKFRNAYPDRFFDVGIAESHAVCFAAGLAKEGFKPIIGVYSTFLQRAFDQIIEDVALQELPVVFAIDRAGISGEDGVTHQGIFDISFLNLVPNIVIMAPKDFIELEYMLEFAFKLGKPVAIRYPKGIGVTFANNMRQIELGKAEILKKGDDFMVIAYGSMVSLAQEALENLFKEGKAGTLVNARFAKPLDKELFITLATKFKHIFTIEEGVLNGGFGSSVAEVINRQVVKIGLPGAFITHGKRELLLDKYGLSVEAIVNKIRTVVG
ncbi:MAG: 1-deoxy-D-xylulose-5-phosphate synthase [Candidatus Omnitrophica bacterium]|nr:1-deoxy-D-xylulose-5-phosphate synthase [Candidatus Omnitrophota bacterium]